MKLYTGQRWALIGGDCRERVPRFAEHRFDAIVTDPPYELGFMGKAWDRSGVAFQGATWAAMLRVLKPGGHLVAFGGSRTFHRIAVAIEDAGFEVRDTLCWLYGQGFPKSLNVLRAMEETGLLCECSSTPQCDMRSVQSADVPSPINVSSEQGQVLLSRLSEPRISASGRTQSASDVRSGEPSLEGRGDAAIGEGQLQGSDIRGVSAGVSGDGTAGRIRDGAPACNGEVAREMPLTNGSCSPPRSRFAQQHAGEPGAVSGQPHPQKCRSCGKTLRESVDGRGTALKPGWEPIILARKPLDGTVAENVQRWGTGALNVDGCRVETTEDLNGGAYAKQGVPRADGWGMERGGAGKYVQPAGRWPPNVCLDEDAAALLDEQAGERKSGQQTKPRGRGGIWTTEPGQAPAGPQYGDSGGASRFFYCAKASRAERDAGCESLPERSGGQATEREDDSAGLSSPRTGAGRGGGARNHHPTVKPIALMRWLVRLVTPPGGAVLDPFSGSGSTGVAVLEEGFSFCGIEQDAEYLEIARCRLERAARERGAA